MHPDALVARLALVRGWIGRDVYERAMAPALAGEETGPGIEDALRAAGLTSDQLRTLRGALGSRTRGAAWMGDWRLLRRVGVGGMGSVFEARHRRTGRRAAVKVLLPRLGRDPEFRQRFLREARVLARLSHPHVVHAYDSGQEGEFFFIAMELVEGENLRDFLEREGCLSPARSAQVALAVARALEAIHAAGLVHRDVKPANVLLAQDGAIKLVDLGLFRDELDRRVLWDGMVFGTPQYMSPEQVLGSEDIDIRSDLYSLGATWYHSLLGRTPFQGDTPQAVARAQVEEAPVPPRDLRPDVPLAMDRLILSLLEKDPADRPAAPSQAVRSIEALLTDAVVEPRREGRHRMKLSRTRLLVGGLGALAAAACAWLLFFPAAGEREPGRGGAGGLAATPGSDPGSHDPVLPEEAVPEELPARLATLERGLEQAAQALARTARAALPRLSLREEGDTSLREGGRGAPAPEVASPAPEPRHVPAAAARPQLPAALEEWASRTSAAAPLRFFRTAAALSPPQGMQVLLRDGSAARVRPARSGVALEAEDGSQIPLSALHPAAVLAWASVEEADASTDGGVAFALEERLFDAARLLAASLRPPLPPEVGEGLEALPPASPPAGEGAAAAGQAFLAAALADVRTEREASEALRQGRFEEARQAFAALLEPRAPSPLFPARSHRWRQLGERARTLALQKRLFAGVLEASRPFEGAAVSVRYGFAGPAELADFRFHGPAWQLGRPSLRRLPVQGERVAWPRESRGGGRRPAFIHPLETLGLFSAPLVVEARVSRAPPAAGRAATGGPAMVAVGFAGRFVLAAAGQLLAWEGDLEDLSLASLPEPHEGVEGVLRLEFSEERAAVSLPGGRRSEVSFPAGAPGRLPAPGRVVVALSPGGVLEELRLEGVPDPEWTAGRMEAIEVEGR